MAAAAGPEIQTCDLAPGVQPMGGPQAELGQTIRVTCLLVLEEWLGLKS